jgi:hypothetical protein
MSCLEQFIQFPFYFLPGTGKYDKMSRPVGSGEMAERFKAPVLKTGLVKANVGSNPSLSAWFFLP